MTRPPYSKKLLGGFTLIELLITLAVAAIVMIIGVPNMTGLIQKNKQVTATNELVTALNYARSQAIKTGKHISLCPSSDGNACATGTVDWTVGTMVFINNAFSTVSSLEEDEQILRVFDAVDGSISLKVSGNINRFISFRPTGDSDFQGSWVFCDKRGAEFAKAVSLFRSGRAAVSSTLWDDSSLTCGSAP